LKTRFPCAFAPAGANLAKMPTSPNNLKSCFAGAVPPRG
jgi:hypothetical protein